MVGRLIGFSVVAMDNLRLSMNKDLSDTKVLHYRSNAVALSRAAEQCRTILVVLQDNRKPGQKPLTIPAPAIAAAPAEMVQTKPLAIKPGQHPRTSVTIRFPETTEAAKQDARMLLAMFARNGGASAQTTAIFPHIPDPAAAVDAAVRQAFSASRQNAAA